MLRHALILALLVAVVAPTLADDSSLTITPTADLRVRQEVLDGVYHWAGSQSDRNWIRVRTRAGFKLDAGEHHGELRLANEHRHYITPDEELDWDEVLVDRFLWRWSPREDLTVTLGRQDIIWPGGFLVLEGHPLDGSRTIFHDGVRLQTEMHGAKVDVAVVHNERRAKLVLLDDAERDLTFGDETGLLARLVRGAWTGSFIVKDLNEAEANEWGDTTPDLRTYTLGGRYAGPAAGLGTLEAEVALQYQDGVVPVRVAPDGETPEHGWAVAGQAFLKRPLPGDLTMELGGFYYSGAGDNLRPFQSPWGSWPKWSELYIYTLLGESTGGRPHVAHWENVVAPRLQLRRPLSERLSARAGATWLLAPEPELISRGVLAQAELKAKLPHDLTGHLLLEWFDPGAFHDGRHGLASFDDPVTFMRWQMSWAF